MSQLEAKVIGETVELPNGNIVEVGSKQWFQWLDNPTTESFTFCDGVENMTVRRELVRGWRYWYAYKRMGSKVHKRYVGKSSKVTQARLLEVERSFNKLPKKLGNKRSYWGNKSEESRLKREFEKEQKSKTVATLQQENQELKEQVETIKKWHQTWLTKCQGKEGQPRWQNLYKALSELELN